MSGDLLLRRARIWARPGAGVTEPRDVLIRAGRIVAVGVDLAAEASIPELDLAGRVVAAGFWNCHVHLTERVWSRAARDPAAAQAAIDDMMLRRGFTGVVDLGSLPRTTNRIIRRIGSGELRGPRVLTAGIGIRPVRGMPFYMRPMVPWFARWMLPMPATRRGARRVVRRQLAGGASVVKLFTGSYVTPERVKPMRRAVARAAVAEAHRRGARVLAHPSDRRGTSVAIDAGVDALAHVPDETEGTRELLAEAAACGIRVVPTLHMFAATVRPDESYTGPIRAALAGFVAAGGRVLFGTDVGYMPDRDTAPELEAMARAGLSVDAILASLTTEPAAFLGADVAGSGVVEPGGRADLTVLDVTHAPQPADLARIHAVVRDGVPIWPAG
ncbi:amidohydrolase family protein [Clavibacter michiganensis subsp. phaseoli]|uniref:Amidohydrolase family protein n=1 Tax=Clavibacter phaseoli TaxID=1734031 RepID=A0A8I0SCN8_9MICO|nr:amidohydrolase family protein [Clavibacter phaseoli]MBF4630895.1 amidohydrolase family protein [Clavibacter phaseoli]